MEVSEEFDKGMFVGTNSQDVVGCEMKGSRKGGSMEERCGKTVGKEPVE